MTTTYTDAQIESMASMLRVFGDSNFENQVKLAHRAADMLRSLLTERQAGSSGDVPYIEIAYRAGFISACNWPEPCSQDVDSLAFKAELSKFIETHTPIFQPPQPPTKESVRGVSDDAAALAHFTDYFARNYPGPSTIISDPLWHAPKIFRAAKYALQQFANRDDGDE